MKHLKKYESMNFPISTTLLPEYNDLVFIERPSEKYFKSSIRFTLVFVDKVYKEIYDKDNIGVQYNIRADISFQRSEYSNGDSYVINPLDKNYHEDDFKKIDFMTIEEFYNKYKSSFEKILEIVLDKLTLNLRANVKEQYEKILKKLTTPETEHIINSRKYNI